MRSFLSSHRHHIAYGLFIVACGLLVLALPGYIWQSGHPLSATTGNLALFAMLIFAVALWFKPSDAPRLQPLRRKTTWGRVNWVVLAMSAFLLFVLGEVNGRVIWPDVRASQHAQMCYLVLAALGMARAFSGRWRWSGAMLWHYKRGHMALLVAIILLAFAVRVWQVDDWLRFPLDETSFALGVVELRDDATAPLLQPFHWIAAFTSVYPYLQARAVDIFGPDWLALRMVSVVFGTLTIPALYLLATTLFDRRTALLAALILAIFPPHIFSSRVGMNNIADPFFGVMALAFLARGFKYNRLSDYALAGIMLGLTHYFYEGGRLLFTGLLIIWLVMVIVVWRLHQHWRGWLALLVAMSLMVLPFYYTLLNGNYALTPRWDERGNHARPAFELTVRAIGDAAMVRLLGLEEPPHDTDVDARWWHIEQYVRDKILPPAHHIIYYPDGSGIYYGGDYGLVMWYALPFFFMGLVWALLRLRLAGWFILVWVLATLFGNSLVNYSNWSARFVVVYPALALLIAIGLRHTLDWLLSGWRATDRDGILLILAGGLVFAQVGYYFDVHLDHVRTHVYADIQYDHLDALYRAEAYPDGSYLVYLTPSYVGGFILDAWLALRQRDIIYAIYDPRRFVDWHLLPRNVPLLLAIEPSDTATLQAIESHFDVTGPYWSDNPALPRANQFALYVVRQGG